MNFQSSAYTETASKFPKPQSSYKGGTTCISFCSLFPTLLYAFPPHLTTTCHIYKPRVDIATTQRGLKTQNSDAQQ